MGVVKSAILKIEHEDFDVLRRFKMKRCIVTRYAIAKGSLRGIWERDRFFFVVNRINYSAIIPLTPVEG